jgi:stage II sporulation protein M
MVHRIGRRYAVGLATLGRARSSMALALILFSLGASVGVLRPEWVRAMLSGFDLASFGSPVYVHRLVAYFIHNALADYLVVWLGRLRGVAPVLALLANGAALAGVVRLALRSHSIGDVVLGTVPHGVFELPANLIAGGLGIWVGATAWAHADPSVRRKRCHRANVVFCLFVLPLLVIAAAIEARP